MSIVKDPALAEAGRKKIQWVRDFMPALSQIEARFPVSYTHLTLPTIA